MQFTSPTATSRWRSRSLASTVAATALLLGACIEDFSAPDPSGPVADVLISTIPLNEAMEELFVGTTRQLLAGPQNEDGQFVPGQSVTWSSSNESVVSVTQNGVATAVSSGNAVISATAGGVTGTTEMKVRFPVGQVTVTPAGGTIRREGAIQLTANVVDAGGTPRTNRTVTWASLSPAIATVSASGLVSGVTDGQAVITATSEGVSGQATITVFGSPVIATFTLTGINPGLNPLGTMQLQAVARAGSGTIISDAVVLWESSNTAVATVSQTGLAQLLTNGNAIITATVQEGTTTFAQAVSFTASDAVTLLPVGGPLTVPGIPNGGVFLYVVAIPAGTTSFNVSITGGTGDADIYVFPPAAEIPTGFGASGTASQTPLCRPWAIGSTESCTINNPAHGNFVVAIHAYPGDGAVNGLTITHTRTPAP